MEYYTIIKSWKIKHVCIYKLICVEWKKKKLGKKRTNKAHNHVVNHFCEHQLNSLNQSNN